jgi:hypothetical protein
LYEAVLGFVEEMERWFGRQVEMEDFEILTSVFFGVHLFELCSNQCYYLYIFLSTTYIQGPEKSVVPLLEPGSVPPFTFSSNNRKDGRTSEQIRPICMDMLPLYLVTMEIDYPRS